MAVTAADLSTASARPQWRHEVRSSVANEERFWASAILDFEAGRHAWCVLIRTESKIGRNFGARELGFSVLLLFCRELRLLFLKALCVYDDEKSLWSSSSLELLLFHFLASRKLLSHAETLIKERRRPLLRSCKAENLDSFRCLHGICQNRMVKKNMGIARNHLTQFHLTFMSFGTRPQYGRLFLLSQTRFEPETSRLP